MTVDPTAFVQAQTRLAAASLVPELRLHLADAALPLWEATEATLAETGLPPPYWAFAWPGGQALARLLLDRPELARGRRVLDFGAGCGLASLAAARSGAAAVTAADIDPFARAAIALNAAANGLSVAITGEPVTERPADADLLLIGDMCYERPLADLVLPWARAAAASGVAVLLADPGRSYRPTAGLAEIGNYDVPTSLDLEDRTVRTTRIYRLAATD